MTGFAVSTPILNGPFTAPTLHWRLEPGEPPEQQTGRREAGYWYREPNANVQGQAGSRGLWRPLKLANTIRERVTEWRRQSRPGITRTTIDLFEWWEREGRHPRLFFAQIEAVETQIFLTEARADFLQGIEIPLDTPSPEKIAEGTTGFRRRCAKMATGTGKSTVAAMLAAWSILNKIADRSDARFSDTVLITCPNVTIRRRLNELHPSEGDASLYRTRDLVPPNMMPDLSRGTVIITNWHAYEPQSPGTGARVDKRGVARTTTETITIAGRTTTARGNRYYTPAAFDAAVAAGELIVRGEERDSAGNVVKATVRATRHVESDAALVARILGRAGGKQNVLVINDEAHHAYRIPAGREGEAPGQLELDPDEAEDEPDAKEATIWIEGLDRIHKVRGINFCIDLSATPYFLGRMGDATNTVFPWVVSDFGLTDAIESGLVKVPQLVAADDSGHQLPAYFNIWEWIKPHLTTAERGTARSGPKPEAILKHAHISIAILGGMWSRLLHEWAVHDDPRPPVFILVAKNKRLAKTLYEWLAEGRNPHPIAPAGLPDLENTDGRTVTIRVDTSVVAETDSGNAQSDETAWMRLTLDTVGSVSWPVDQQGRPLYPEGFEDLAKKLDRPLHPPGRDIRCIVSVGMLTEGWDCNTVTHVIGLRPFQSQLLCEQVVGRALRRRSYQLDEDGKFSEETAKIFGVPFEIIPFKAANTAPKPKPQQRLIRAVPQKARHAIQIPNVGGYQSGIRNRITTADWATVPATVIDPQHIPPTAAMAASLVMQRPSVTGPGGSTRATLEAFRAGHSEQELAFQMSADLTRLYTQQPTCEIPAHSLFPQILRIVQRYLREKVTAQPPSSPLDAFLSPYYGWIIENLLGAIRPDEAAGETPELPDVDDARPLRTADINFFTSRPTAEAARTHLNLVVNDTQNWEQSLAYQLDHHPAIRSFVKNSGLRFVIPYLHNDTQREYEPDFIARLEAPTEHYLIAELKGADWDSTEIKAQAAHRWCAAINATARYGKWHYLLAWKVSEVVSWLNRSPHDAPA